MRIRAAALMRADFRLHRKSVLLNAMGALCPPLPPPAAGRGNFRVPLYGLYIQKTSLVRGGFLPISGESDPEMVGERKKVNQHSPVERVKSLVGLISL